VRAAESARADAGDLAVTNAVARNYFKLMAIKDEYEVARLYADPGFGKDIATRFEGDYRIHFHFAPPLISRPDPETGRIRKRMYGPWIMRLMPLLARLKVLRGTALDIFGRSAERRMERALLAEYEADIAWLLDRLPGLPEGRLGDAARFAAWPDQVRGFGHVKAAAVERMRVEKPALRTAVEPAA
jgi:indolepyruvate ferredoxin oxidoreductase